jgi:DNA-binding transcriptional regulator YiaG
MTGDQFAQLRFELNWTQQEVADQLGVTRFTVSRWEGQEEVPRMAELALRCLVRDLRADLMPHDGP